MEKTNTFGKLVVAGAALLVAGAIVFLVGLGLSGWKFSALSTVTYEQKSYTAEGEISSVSVEYSNADILVVVDEGAERVTLSYPVGFDKVTDRASAVTLEEKEGKLTVTEAPQQFWFGFSVQTPAFTLTLPAGEYADISLSTANGNVSARGLKVAGTLALGSENGNISLSASEAGKASLSTKNGNIAIEDVMAETLSAESALGDIAQAGALEVGTLTCSTELGDVSLDKALVQSAQLSSELGDVTAHLSGVREDYSVTVRTEMGECNISSYVGGARDVTAQTSMGDIFIAFEN